MSPPLIEALDVAEQVNVLARLLTELPNVDVRQTPIVGIHTGGCLVADALCQQLGVVVGGQLNVGFYRDDLHLSGLKQDAVPTQLPPDIDGQTIILVDDVLATGRTIRAAINEIFDHGRPARIVLAVLAERGGRQLPIHADCVVWQPDLTATQTLKLRLNSNQFLYWSVV